jgi:hypothetical protein
MSSTAKLAANRANALHSTGPADTSRTRFNGLAHGLTSRQTVIRGEDQQEYGIFHTNLLQDLAPGSPTEEVVAERIVAAAWRLKRFVRVESAFFNNRIDAFLDDNPDSDPDAALANLFTDPGEMARMRLFLRYQTTVQREYDTAMRELTKVKADRLSHAREIIAEVLPRTAERPAVGFASQSLPRAEVRAACTATNVQSPRDTLASK